MAAIRTEPPRESAHRLLIEVHRREGNVAEALRQVGSYATPIRRELGAAPSPIICSPLTRAPCRV